MDIHLALPARECDSIFQSGIRVNRNSGIALFAL